MKTKMLTAHELAQILAEIMFIHSFHAREGKQFRQFDGRTPSGVHSVLLMMLILHEESLPEALRVMLALAIGAHDIPEDSILTRLPLWATTDPEVEALVRGMTFADGEDKYTEMWKRGDMVLLLELFDCTVNLMCAATKKPGRTAICQQAVRGLIAYFEPKYPKLEIIKIAKGLLGS